MVSNKIDALGVKINKKIESINNNSAKKYDVNISMGLKIATDLISGVLVALMLGIYLDKQFKTAPLLLLICLCFGIFGSIRNIILTIKRNDAS